jgi:VWFA-related protein
MRVSIALCLLACLVTAGAGQSGRMRTKPPVGDKEGDKDALRLRAEEVLLPISVRSENGKLPSRLDRSDFIITEDNKRQRITAVMRTPANILLVIDTSGEASTLKNININRDLALMLVESLGEEDRAAIVTYADKVELIQQWTGDKAVLKEALAWKFKPGFRSRMYDSLLFAAHEVLPAVTGRRSVVLLTDGVDSFEKGAFEEVLTAMHRARATVYIVTHAAMLIRELRPRVFHPLAWWEMLDPQVRKKYLFLRQYVRELEAGEITLRGLAEETGGAMWNPENRIDCRRSDNRGGNGTSNPLKPDSQVECETIRNQIVREIGTEYVIAYSSEREPDDNRFHPVRVYVTRTDLKVRARRGIYPNLPPTPSKPGTEQD